VIEGLVLIPVIGGSVFAVLCLIAVLSFARRPKESFANPSPMPPVTVLKPVCGLEKNLEANLRSICIQDYPAEFQVVFSVQDPHDSTLPLLKAIQQDFGHDRVAVVITRLVVGPN